MVVRILDKRNWRKTEIKKGKMVIPFPGHGKRKLTFKVNCVAETRLDLVELDRDDARTTFLWAGRGMEEVEVYAEGYAEVVVTSAEDVFFHTTERSGIAHKDEEAGTFTKIANRRARNPELDAIMLRAEINMNRRLARLEMEMERKYGGAGKRINMETGEVTDERAQESADDTGGAGGGTAEPEGAAQPKGPEGGDGSQGGTDAGGTAGASGAK